MSGTNMQAHLQLSLIFEMAVFGFSISGGHAHRGVEAFFNSKRTFFRDTRITFSPVTQE